MRRRGLASRAADSLLWVLIVAAPLAAGSWRLEVLPALLGLAIVAWGATFWGLMDRRRDLHIGLLPVSLVILAALTALQAVPLPPSLLTAISPETQALYAFVRGDAGGGPLSYEPGATLREATKLVVYALVAQVALERCRGRGLTDRIAVPLVAAGLVAAGIAVLHRALGIERLFGLVDTVTTTRGMVTTFVNPNHAAGFMALVAVTAVGVVVRESAPRRKAAFGVAALVAAALCLSTGSKGGIGALVLGLGLFAVAFRVRDRGGERKPLGAGVAAVGAVGLLAPAAFFTWNLRAIAEWLEPADRGVELGLVEKAAAMQDALPMLLDHRWFGIGRGAYVSVYTRYKTSDLQLTFTFPENVIAQLTSEWGLPLGLMALVGLGAAGLGRLWSVQRTVGLAMVCGVAAVLSQNLVDFGLELPGLAVPAAAILGAVCGDWTNRYRLSTARPPAWAVGVLVPALGVVTCALAFVQGDLPRDLVHMQARIEAARAKSPVPDDPATEVLLARHPASALMAAQAAYLAEISDPPRPREAVRWANRALYLAPSYADGHLVAGRLLVRAGVRAQGFGELRRAWSLAGSDRRPIYLRHVLELAKDPDEIARAIPRRDPALDILSERDLALAVRQLAAAGRKDWAATLLEQHVRTQTVPAADLRAVTVAADAVGATELALALGDRLIEAEPKVPEHRLLLARVAFRHGRAADARRLLGEVGDPNGALAPQLLELRLRLEIADRDLAAGEATLAALEAATPPGRKSHEALALLAVELFRAGDRPDRAREALDRAISAYAGSTVLRLRRAKLLLEMQRPGAAISDLQYVLARHPDHAEARALDTQAQRAVKTVP